jgi:hypothetical protein
VTPELHDVCSSCDYYSTPSEPFPYWQLDSNKTYGVIEPEDVVNNPKHYTGHPSGIECIQVTEYMGFCLGNAIKYIWRANDKHESPLEDLKKAKWYIEREIKRLEKE